VRAIILLPIDEWSVVAVVHRNLVRVNASADGKSIRPHTVRLLSACAARRWARVAETRSPYGLTTSVLPSSAMHLRCDGDTS